MPVPFWCAVLHRMCRSKWICAVLESVQLNCWLCVNIRVILAPNGTLYVRWKEFKEEESRLCCSSKKSSKMHSRACATYSLVAPLTWTRWGRTYRYVWDWWAPVTSRRSPTSTGEWSYTADQPRRDRPSTRSVGARCSSSQGGSSRSWTACDRPAPSELESEASRRPSWRCACGLARGRWRPDAAEALTLAAQTVSPWRHRPSPSPART